MNSLSLESFSAQLEEKGEQFLDNFIKLRNDKNETKDFIELFCNILNHSYLLKKDIKKSINGKRIGSGIATPFESVSNYLTQLANYNKIKHTFNSCFIKKKIKLDRMEVSISIDYGREIKPGVDFRRDGLKEKITFKIQPEDGKIYNIIHTILIFPASENETFTSELITV